MCHHPAWWPLHFTTCKQLRFSPLTTTTNQKEQSTAFFLTSAKRLTLWVPRGVKWSKNTIFNLGSIHMYLDILENGDFFLPFSLPSTRRRRATKTQVFGNGPQRGVFWNPRRLINRLVWTYENEAFLIRLFYTSYCACPACHHISIVLAFSCERAKAIRIRYFFKKGKKQLLFLKKYPDMSGQGLRSHWINTLTDSSVQWRKILKSTY